MKIRKLKIKNYKIFKDIEFDFTDKNGKTLDTIVLAGINGTGKTTLLKFLSFLLMPNINFDFNKYISNIEVEFDENEIDTIKNNYSQIFDKPFSSETQREYEKEIRKSNILRFEYDYFNAENPEQGEYIVIISDEIPYLREIIQVLDEQFKIAYFHNNIFLNDKEKISKDELKPLNVIDYKNFEQDIEKYFDKVIYNYLKEHRTETYEEVTNKRITEINYFLKGLNVSTKIIDIDGNKLVLENISGEKLQVSDLSDGEKQIYFRAIFLNSLEIHNSIILVDEPELSLHPTWQSYVVKLYEKAGKNNQVFLATHSPHIISSVNPENLFVLYHNEKDKKIKVANMQKAGKHTKGVEPNRILKQIMCAPLRDSETQKKIDYVARNLDKDFEKKEMKNKINELFDALGQDDPFIIGLNHQLLLLNRKKSKS